MPKLLEIPRDPLLTFTVGENAFHFFLRDLFLHVCGWIFLEKFTSGALKAFLMNIAGIYIHT